MGKRKYLIWSNEHDARWAPNSNGYTQSMEEAGIYEETEAMRIVASDPYWLNKPHETLYPAVVAKRTQIVRKRASKISFLPDVE